MKCIFCFSTLSAKTKPEHILLNALGGKTTTKKAVCTSCNERFGIGPDQDLADSVREIRNLAQLFSGDGDPPPPVSGAKVEDGRYDISSHGTPIFVPNKPFSVTQDGGGYQIELHASNEAHADRLTTSVARKILKDLGYSDYPDIAVQKIKADIEKDGRRKLSTVPPKRGQIALGEGASQQSMAKAALVLWAYYVGGDKVCSQKYDTIRKFCGDGLKPENPEGLVTFDTRMLPTLPPQFGSNPTLIWAGSNWMGQVYGYFRLYDIIGWRFRLCEFGGDPNTSVCLISNPFEPHIWNVGRDGGSHLTYEWIGEASNNQADQITSRFSLLGQRGQILKLQRYIETTIKSAFSDLNLSTEDHLSSDQEIAFKEYILKRLKVLITREAFEEDFNKNKPDKE